MRLGQRLSRVRHQQFVGRARELELFRVLLDASDLPAQVLWAYGPGGIGKTSLLAEFARHCRRRGVPCISLDGRSLEPTPGGFESQLQLALELDGRASPLERLAPEGGRQVLLIDTYELLAPLDGWLRESFLPELPESVLVVLAGRTPPPAAWRSDPGWQAMLRELPLRNLASLEAAEYLQRRGVPGGQHAAVLGFTHAHPLALSLVADLFAQREGFVFVADEEPDVVRSLLAQLLEKVPGPAHRAAVEASALVRLTTEPLLAAMLEVEDAHDLFEWLRDLSFVEASRLGLFPHDLAREALAVDVRWRNPDWHAELHRRARAYYRSRLPEAPPDQQQRILLDYIFLHRDNPVVRPFFERLAPEESGGQWTDRATAEDVPDLVAMVSRHEGEASARLARHWLEHRLQGALVVREGGGRPVGLLFLLSLEDLEVGAEAKDPAVQAVLSYLRRHAPLRPGEAATLFRFWMAREEYQEVSVVQGHLMVSMVRHYLTTPGLAYTFLPCARAEFWAPLFAYADLERLPEADFQVGGRGYGVFGHDWRRTPPLQWLAILGERETSDSPAAPPEARPDPLVVLDREAFGLAARQALKAMADHQDLARSPLLGSRLILARTGPRAPAVERAEVLQSLIREACQAVRGSRRGEKPYLAVYHTYVRPAGSQAQVSEQLGLPFTTYRRHLTRGVERIVERLWEEELGGPGATLGEK